MATSVAETTAFGMTPTVVPQVRTKFRRIHTPLPVPDSLPVLEALSAYEARSMHGQLPVVWDRAKDFQVWDRFGNCWIDFTSTIFVANVGHANPAVTQAIEDALKQGLVHSYTFATEIRARYLRQLIHATPRECEKAFLVSSGTEATECAVKLIRLHGRAAGKRRGGVVSFEGSMHGRTMLAQMLGGTPAARAWIGYDDPNVHRLPFPCPWEVQDGAERFAQDLAHLAAQGVDAEQDLAGFILEPYLGWGAIFFPSAYVQALAQFTRQHHILLVFDEIQAGFGRTGRWFAYQHYGVEADLVCCGKGMSSSLPLAGVLGKASLLDLPEAGSMSSTHSANPLSCAAGLATLQQMEALDLVQASQRKGERLLAGLHEIQRRFPAHVLRVCGKGLLAALHLADPATGLPDTATASRVCERAMQKGLLVVHTGRESIKIGPPLTISDEALAEGVEVLAEALQEIIG